MKGPVSLGRVYLLIALAGLLFLGLIAYGFYSGERLQDLNSPLLAAIKEIQLETGAAKYGIREIIKGNADLNPEPVWAYVDEAIWYLQILLNEHFNSFADSLVHGETDVKNHIENLKFKLESIKNLALSRQNLNKTAVFIDHSLLQYDQMFAEFTSELDHLEITIRDILAKDRLFFRLSHVFLVLLSVAVAAVVGFTIRRYEHYRASSYDALNTTNKRLKHQIEERERAEKALRESENLFRTVFDTSPDSIILSRLKDNTIVAVNNGFIELTGFSKEEVLGKTALDLSLWEDIEKRERFISVLESSRSVRNFESRFRMKNGHLQTALLSVNIVDIGEVSHFITVARNISDLKEAQDALRASEEKFRGLFEHAVDFIHLLDVEGRILLSNPAAIRGLGYPLAQLQNRPLADLVDPAAKSYFVDMMTHLVEEGHFRTECNLITGDGRTVTVDCSAAPVRNDAGKIDFIVLFQEDISDRKAYEKKLMAVYECLQIANRNNDLKTLLTEFIAATRRMTGCGAAAVRIVGENSSSPYAEADGFSVEPCRLEHLPASEKDQGLCVRVVKNETAADLPFLTPNGSFFTNRASPQAPGLCARKNCLLAGYRSLALIPIRLGAQNLGLVYIADKRENMLPAETIDILETATMQLGMAVKRLRAEEGLQTAYQVLEERVMERTLELLQANAKLAAQVEERRRTEESLRKSHKMLQTVIDGIKDSLILVDQDMHIRMANRVASEYYGLGSPQQAIGRVCYQASGHVGPCEGCEIPQAVLRGEPIAFERKGLMHPDRLEAVSIYPVSDTNSPIGGAIVKIADITEEKRLERQLVQSEKMASLGILVSSIAHEINNPNNFVSFNIPIMRDYLEALVGIADEYAQTHADVELFHMSYDEFRRDVFKLVDNIEHGSRRISSFVANLREFSQDNGSRRKEWLDLTSITEKVLTICRSQIKKRVKTFDENIPEGLPPIYADAYSIEQVLLNLILNAVQAADKKDSRVALTATGGTSWQDHTIITVSDNGCGMDQKTMQKIFDPFFTTKSTADGTGLGLYVCHNLVQGLGGRIEVESEPGKGSTFTITIPDKDRRRVPRN